ncbi:hypothetical protein Patl1_07072 [Pistacia atlantica]|uniref:Uncharacterized protein n=1 Tax=Pistacia atlantica TaxID=434234 RepID=A0ACC1AJD5_9ROSI|nr:hypothetical protein Patl1_07072 [Pistacia atlantica]
MKDSIVIYPSPGRGHLVSMIELAKLIVTHYPSFSITVIIPEAPFETGSTDEYVESISATVPSITFHHLPTIPTTTTTTTSATTSSSSLDLQTQTFELSLQNNHNFHQALLLISKSSNIKALILDFFCNPSFKISAILEIPTYYYKPGGLSSLTVFLNLPTFHKNTKKSLKELGNKEINIPGMPVPLRAKDMPYPMQDRTRKVYHYFLETAIQMPKSAGIIVNTVETLEKTALNAILDGQCTPRQPAPRIYCIEPLIVSSDGSRSGESRHECLNWLDMQPKGSVVFLSFGSLGKFSAPQLKEMALGLEKSGVRFLWVVRPPEGAVDAILESLLPQGFLERTRDRGYVAKSWAPQVQVLSHESVGGFVCHCGWNSVLEAIRGGVPMLVWPLYAENKLNKVSVVEELKVALAVEAEDDGLVSAEELEKLITKLINSKEGKLIKERVMGLKEEVSVALKEGGPSRVALANLIESILKN